MKPAPAPWTVVCAVAGAWKTVARCPEAEARREYDKLTAATKGVTIRLYSATGQVVLTNEAKRRASA